MPHIVAQRDRLPAKRGDFEEHTCKEAQVLANRYRLRNYCSECGSWHVPLSDAREQPPQGPAHGGTIYE